MYLGTAGVALLAEGVGRNKPRNFRLQSQRAVALLAEGVGRNNPRFAIRGVDKLVALLAEGVGRNDLEPWKCYIRYGRPPRGGRG